MEPELNSTPSTPLQTPLPPSTKPPYALIAFVSVGALAICLFGWLAWHAFQASGSSPFHVVSTNPSVDKMATTTPFLKLTFNKPLSSDGLKVTSDPDIVSGTSVSDKTLTISLKVPMDNTKEYTVKLVTISDTTGDKVTNQTYKFQPAYVESQKQPADQQQALVQQQDPATQPYGLETIAFNNFDNVLDLGVTADQESNLEYAFFQYGKAANPHTGIFEIDPNSLSPGAHDKTSPNFTLNFNVTLDNATTYKARMVYPGAGTAIHLFLYDSASGALKYDSGDVNVNNND